MSAQTAPRPSVMNILDRLPQELREYLADAERFPHIFLEQSINCLNSSQKEQLLTEGLVTVSDGTYLPTELFDVVTEAAHYRHYLFPTPQLIDGEPAEDTAQRIIAGLQDFYMDPTVLFFQGDTGRSVKVLLRIIVGLLDKQPESPFEGIATAAAQEVSSRGDIFSYGTTMIESRIMLILKIAFNAI